MKAKNKVLAIVLSFVMMLAMIPAEAFATGATTSGKLIISDKIYEVAPGVKEREYITNNKELSAQQMGHILEVELGDDAQIITGYNDYNIESIKSGKSWGMRKTTEQAQRIETVRKVNVVGAVNGDFFDMSNGKPLGTLVMNGTVVQKGARPCFYVDKDNVAHIADTAENIPAGTKEAIGGAYILIRNGQVVNTGDTTTNPRTAVGIKADGKVVLYMVDGRQAPLSVGMTGQELAQTMLDLGCVEALNLDGGGSSTFATQRAGDVIENNNQTAGLTLRCSPSDGYERTVSSSLMVISTAVSDNKFDHAVISPKQEVYTPGSKVQFTAQGADKSGANVPLPDTGLTWEISGNTAIGTINVETGEFTGKEDQTGTATVVLKYNGKTVGQTSVELQWPDKLEFTNSSVSLDFGEKSDLTFAPTWQGRKVNYKDGDFEWGVDEESDLTYRSSVPVEIYTKPGWGGYDAQVAIPLTGKIGETAKGTVYYSNYLVYETSYEETSREITESSGKILVEATITHTGAKLYSYINGELLKDNIMEDVDETINSVVCKVKGIKQTQKVEFSLGELKNNLFIADKDTSFRGKIKVNIKNNDKISGCIDVVVGMEPYVLMDFEDGHKDPISGNVLSAENYWTFHVGNSSDNGGNTLSLRERKKYRLMMRDTTGKGVAWPKNNDGSEKNQLVSASDNTDVRFGNHALQLAWDFRKIDESTVAAADFGFSSMIYTHVVQPTKIGFWLNVPKELGNDASQIKMIFVGGITEIADTSESDVATKENAYYDMDADGTLTWYEHKLPKGTTQYLNYYSHDAEGNITGSELKDWAGKGWTWVEADLSGAKFPIGIQYGYTVRIVSPQNHVKQEGHVLIDNLQLIYGTNTNDINNPVIDSVVERSSGIDLKTSSKPTIKSTQPIFDIPMNDSKATDKYASGIDTGSIKLTIDGYECTDKAEITQNPTGDTTVLLQTGQLTNGEHSLKIRVKDTYGNETVETYSFVIESEEAVNSAVKVVTQDSNPVVGETYELKLQNQSESEAEYVASADVTIDVGTAYGNVMKDDLSKYIAYGQGYEESKQPEYSDGKVTVHAKQIVQSTGQEISYDKTICSLSLPVPTDARKGDTLSYAVPSGYYVSNTVGMTFSQAEEKIPLTAKYDITAGQAIAGFPVTFQITDEEGNEADASVKVYDSQDNELGNPYTFDTDGRKTVYAKDAEGRRSWNYDIVVSALGTDDEGKPFGIQNNASTNGSSSKNITWLAAIATSKDAALIRLSDSPEKLESAVPLAGTSKLMTFTQTGTGDAYRFNEVKLKNLTPGTTYWYQAGDGEKWSEPLKFTTAAEQKDAKTNFFVFADIQTNDTANLSAAISRIASGNVQYDFGIQTGDAIDNVTAFNNWRGYLTTLNSQKLGGIDVIHTLGNHEYYGDSEGNIAGMIFSLPKHSAGSYYSSEYGSVYTGVVNDGGDILNALAEAKKDAAKSDCAWKVLVFHQPIYGTESVMSESKRLEVVNAIEEAGFDIVLSGDDHAYARTYPMKGDKALAENSREGVVYYVCGDLSSKDNEYHEQEYFAESIPHREYTGMYMSVEADGQEMTLNAYKYDGSLLDSYTIKKTDCELDRHTFNEDCTYNLADKTINCILCAKSVAADDSGYTGMLATSDGGGKVMLAAGKVKTGWFTLGQEIYHAGANGLLHKTETKDTATCLEDGHIVSTCECGASYTGAYTYSKGHDWNSEYVCKVCGTNGKNLADVLLTLNGQYWEYTGSPIRASVIAKDGDYVLNATSDRTGRDAYKSYQNNTKVGLGTVIFEGRGNYYGTKSIQFPIIPRSVKKLRCGNALQTLITLNWDAAGGAEYYRVYMKENGGNWKHVDDVTNNGIIVSDLKPETEYTFCVGTAADVDGVTYRGVKWSDELKVSTTKSTGKKTADAIRTISTVVEDTSGTQQMIKMSAKEGEYYLFLPSYADISDFKLNFDCDEENQNIMIIGSKAVKEFNGNSLAFDIAEVMGDTTADAFELGVAIAGMDPMKIHVMKSSEVRSLYLMSSSEAENRDFVDASKQNKTTGTMQLVDSKGLTIYNGGLKQIKARGNSTFGHYPKKSYQIKLEAASDLLDQNENVKTWVLLANYGDATQMHDKLFKDLAAKLGMPYVASCDWVDLYYDGEYRGTYLLSEKNSVQSTGVDISDLEKEYEASNDGYGTDSVIAETTNKYGQKMVYTENLTEPQNITGGYLIERNLEAIDEVNGFYTRTGSAFNVKSPEFAGKEAMTYISEYYQEFEDAVYAKDENGNYTGYNEQTGKYYYEYCDKESLVKVFLLQELALNPDGFQSSFYFYKDKDGILYAGPIWDQDMTLGTGFTKKVEANITYYPYLAEALVQIPDFKQAVKEYYQDTFKDEVDRLLADDGAVSNYYGKLKSSVEMNYKLWPYVEIGSPENTGHLWKDGTKYTDVVNDMTQWIRARNNHLTSLYGNTERPHEHEYESVITKQPTYEAEGVRTYTCKICGATYTEPIDKLTTPGETITPGGGGGYVPSTPVTPSLDAIKANAEKAITGATAANKYDAEEQAEINKIIEKAKADLKAAKTEAEVKAIEEAAKKEIGAILTTADKEEIKAVKGIDSGKFVARSKLITLNGKKVVKITWNEPKGMKLDGFQIYKSSKRYSGYGKKPYFTTTKTSYINNKDLKKDQTYYYKVRGFKVIKDQTIYTGYSTKAIRTYKK